MTQQQRIEKSIRRNPDHLDRHIAKNARCTVAEVAATRMSMNHKALRPATKKASTVAPSEPSAGGGIRLSGMRILPRKPAASAVGFLHKLPTGRGFDVRDLSISWGLSEETIKRHAKDLGCLKFAEVSPGEWVPIAMNPETAKNYA